LRGVVARREILRRRGVGFRLTLFRSFGMRFVVRDRLGIAFVFLVLIGSVDMLARIMRFVLFVVSVVIVNFFGVHFVETSGLRQRFAREQFHRMRGHSDRRRRGVGFVPMTVVVIFQVFEYVADVEEGVAIEANIDERRLHSRKDAGDFAFVDAANKREFFFALDVNLD
jgi:hypothetical protein